MGYEGVWVVRIFEIQNIFTYMYITKTLIDYVQLKPWVMAVNDMTTVGYGVLGRYGLWTEIYCKPSW
jgi:hypothetical protein